MLKAKKQFLTIIVIFGYFIFSGDDCDKEDIPTGVNNNATSTLTLENVFPSSIQDYTSDYEISVKGSFIHSGSYAVGLKVTGPINNNYCNALTINNIMQISSGETKSYNVTQDLNLSCNAPGTYTVSVSAYNGIENVYSNGFSLIVGGPDPLTAKIEYDYLANNDLWDIGGTQNSFLGANIVIAKGTTSASELNDYYSPQAGSEEQLANMLREHYFVQNNNRNLNNGDYKMHLMLVSDGDITSVNNRGISFTYYINNNEDRVSFVMRENVRERWWGTGSPPNTTEGKALFKSAISQSITHELLHQMGGIGNEGHTIHSIDNNTNSSDWCALNFQDNNYEAWRKGIFNLKTTQWYVCTAHIEDLENGSHYSDSPIFPNQISGVKTSDSSLKIYLEKDEYKKYEPIYLKLEYENKSPTKDTIHDLFSFVNSSLEFDITNSKGESFNESKSKIYVNAEPISYIVNPGEKFSVTRKINEFGNPSSPDESYFDSQGYFEEGSYRIMVKGKNSGEVLHSNQLEYKVEALNNEDKKLLQLLKEKKYKVILDSYIESDYWDDVFAYYVDYSYIPEYNKHFASVDEVISLYDKFINKNKESYYLLNPSFIGFLFTKLSNLEAEINMFIEYYNNSSELIREYLQNTSVVKLIKDSHDKIQNSKLLYKNTKKY